MRILIDTHILIWFLEGNESLAKSRQELLSEIGNDVFVSIGSLWEIAIKLSLGKLRTKNSLNEIIIQIESENIKILPISPEHVSHVESLPFHHRDPFDRILISQAQVDGLSVMSSDRAFSDYEVELL